MLAILKTFLYNTFIGWGITPNQANQEDSTMAYTNQMIAKIEAAQPLNLDKAKALASDLGVSYRSIISKAKQMGYEYQAKAPAAKKAKSDEPTKAAILADIRSKMGFADREGDLTKAELTEILSKISV